MSQFLISRKLSFFKTYADAITILSENVCIPFHFWTNGSILKQYGINKVTECYLISLVLTSYYQQKIILDVQMCEVGLTMLVTSVYCDSYSYCISEGATLLTLSCQTTYRTANLQMLHFIYLFNKYTYRIF